MPRLLDTETREPPKRRALKPIRLGVANDDADREGVTQVDVRQLARGAANDGHVACRQGPPKAGICRSLTRHERMFACQAIDGADRALERSS